MNFATIFWIILAYFRAKNRGQYTKMILYTNYLKNRLLDRAKAPGIDDRKWGSIKPIQPHLRSSIRGSFRVGQEADSSGSLCIAPLFCAKIGSKEPENRLKIHYRRPS